MTPSEEFAAAEVEETSEVGDRAPTALEIFLHSVAQENRSAGTYREGDYRIVVNGEGELISCTHV